MKFDGYIPGYMPSSPWSLYKPLIIPIITVRPSGFTVILVSLCEGSDIGDLTVYITLLSGF